MGTLNGIGKEKVVLLCMLLSVIYFIDSFVFHLQEHKLSEYLTRQIRKKGAEAAKVNATQRSCAKCRAAGRHAQALGHKGGNCPYEIIYVSDDDAAIE